MAAEARLAETGLETTGVDDTVCCYATKTETWVTDPDGAQWEWYVKTGDAEQMANSVVGGEGGTCCAPTGGGHGRRRCPRRTDGQRRLLLSAPRVPGREEPVGPVTAGRRAAA